VGELINIGLINSNLSRGCINHLMQDCTPECPIEENLQSLAVLLTNLGSLLSSSSSSKKKLVEDTIQYFKNIIFANKISHNTKFALLDVIDLFRVYYYYRYFFIK
jgi:hypothetical protein